MRWSFLRRAFALAGVMMLCCACPGRSARAQQTGELFTATRQQLDVTKALLAQQAAWNKGDLDAFVEFYVDRPDTTAMLGGPVRGLSNIRTAFHANFPSKENMGQLEETEVEVREMGEKYALVSGRYHLNRARKAGGATDGDFVDIFEKTDKGWRIIFSQTT